MLQSVSGDTIVSSRWYRHPSRQQTASSPSPKSKSKYQVPSTKSQKSPNPTLSPPSPHLSSPQCLPHLLRIFLFLFLFLSKQKHALAPPRGVLADVVAAHPPTVSRFRRMERSTHFFAAVGSGRIKTAHLQSPREARTAMFFLVS